LRRTSSCDRGYCEGYWKSLIERHLSQLQWRDPANMVRPLDNMWSKQTFHVNRISRLGSRPEMLTGSWDTLELHVSRPNKKKRPKNKYDLSKNDRSTRIV
jgi:hypothetical protein